MAKTRPAPIETEEVAIPEKVAVPKPAPPSVEARGDPDQVTAVLMDPDLVTEIAVLRLDVREFVIGYGGKWYEQNAPRPDGSWVYQQQAK